ncbi:MAG: DUF4919 domain-containing protein [Bacteroides sp.]|nr:DUF4919 domain-containing protein [Bacteroides sp.]MBD5271098.1 DUF4919 domain-containing protein [Bacteroides sp.]MBD5332433.1 DUF4919 domain-containing protein [Bacteroides sp.]
MTRFILYIIIIIGTMLPASAQVLPQLKREKPDLEEIRRACLDRTSPYYYPRLMAEFERADTLMKIDKFRHLYLGYMFQEDYNPYRSAERKITYDATLNRARKLTRQECDSVIAYSEKALADNPFNLGEMVMLINALRGKGKNNLANIWQYKLNYLLMAIVSTGTGLDEQNAWMVIDPQHEYVLLNMMDLSVSDHSFYEPAYEYLTVTNSEGKPAGGYYFDIGPLLKEYYRKHPDEL